MKLKKFAAMMLAGVMAVSMLAGCSTGVKPEDPTEETVSGVNAANVIAAMDSKTTEKVAFSAASSELEKNLEDAVNKVVANKGFNNLNNTSTNVYNQLIKIDDELGDNSGFEDYDTLTEDSKVETEYFVSVVMLYDKNDAYTDAYVNNELADEIETVNVNKSKPCKDLVAHSGTYTDGDDEVRYNYSYTGEVAVVEVTNAVDGGSAYYAAFTVVRTPTKATW